MLKKTNVHVISIPSSFRRENITKELQKNNIDFTFFDAITPKDFTLEKNNILKIILTNCEYIINGDVIEHTINRRYMKEGEIACSISHIELCKKLLNDPNNSYYLVLEDDTLCNFSNEEYNKLNNFLLNHINNFDMLYLLNSSPTFLNGKQWNFNLCELIEPCFYKLKNNPPVLLEATNAFIITKNYCNKFLDLVKNNGIFGPADSAIIEMYKRNIINIAISDIEYFKPIFKNNNTYVHETKIIKI